MIAGLIRIVTGVQARWVGCEPEDRQRIYFANHSSNLDGPVIWASLHPVIRSRTRLIAARDYWNGDPIRRYLATRVFKALLINRFRITREDNPLVDMQRALDEGSSLIIFPEGTRQLDEDAGMHPFKAGIFRMAESHPQVQQVPVYLKDLNRVLPRGEYLPVPVMTSVSFGAPLDPLAEGEEKTAYLERARAAVAALADEVDPS